MGRAIALLHDAFVKIQGDGALLLEEEFVMHIFASLYDELLSFKEYLDYHFEEKEGNVCVCVCVFLASGYKMGYCNT